jgi:hypothetical protein
MKLKAPMMDMSKIKFSSLKRDLPNLLSSSKSLPEKIKKDQDELRLKKLKIE